MTLLHEFTHVSWMGNTNANDEEEEEYGWNRCANWAANKVEYDDDTYTQNADSYAW
jgi:hypothetical protein